MTYMNQQVAHHIMYTLCANSRPASDSSLLRSRVSQVHVYYQQLCMLIHHDKRFENLLVIFRDFKENVIDDKKVWSNYNYRCWIQHMMSGKIFIYLSFLFEYQPPFLPSQVEDTVISFKVCQFFINLFDYPNGLSRS